MAVITSADGETASRRRRNAAQTRQDLLAVARARFAKDGYAATTVRDIADQAGVNVALISRYFASKEGLFEACLTDAISDVGTNTDDLERDDIAARLARHLSGSPDRVQLRNALLLLRSSGDERIDGLRHAVLRSLSEKLANAATGRAPADDEVLIRAQLVLGTVLGVVMLRSTRAVQPIADAGEDALNQVFAELIDALLPHPDSGSPS
ncbi:putative TetR-family transcriptional regulator [Actinoplanes missouriensis 431]|uniref:Putative TetR-family transcriptional regulator n=1 Tax=Actinoplanes missouriensis (strain ATCC 14538 / DSM 43046 / CBS 188.64 / JCM 3121 / NBRC 102363 / NCIMB 12654 / NRRL B-3342 / UNCC 431) TaxID=512565 RepID=I0H500_ACTM4|nr:TetR/AcrR family transcriptional regulator [Actinoplanes missouriensis]BAL88087.1 putative TetR-family transcriptional regulator [Actinoplanes missouriensis 431]